MCVRACVYACVRACVLNRCDVADTFRCRGTLRPRRIGFYSTAENRADLSPVVAHALDLREMEVEIQFTFIEADNARGKMQ